MKKLIINEIRPQRTIEGMIEARRSPRCCWIVFWGCRSIPHSMSLGARGALAANIVLYMPYAAHTEQKYATPVKNQL